MSTRCVITVKDEHDTFHVYRHSDGYPESEHGVIAGLTKVVNGHLAWPLPRFEAADFAAAIIAQHKDGGGGYYFSRGPKKHGDLSYEYTVEPVANTSKLKVTIQRPERYSDDEGPRVEYIEAAKMVR